jgi:hypothetical protein
LISGHSPPAVVVALEISKLGHTVYIDASHKRLKAEMQHTRGRPIKFIKQRPDISIWTKADDKLRAIIEIKKAWSSVFVKSDARKIEKYLMSNNSAKTGYILVYSETKDAKNGKNRLNVLEQRFNAWAGKISAKSSWSLIWSIQREAQGEEWAWGFCLLRYMR